MANVELEWWKIYFVKILYVFTVCSTKLHFFPESQDEMLYDEDGDIIVTRRDSHESCIVIGKFYLIMYIVKYFMEIILCNIELFERKL